VPQTTKVELECFSASEWAIHGWNASTCLKSPPKTPWIPYRLVDSIVKIGSWKGQASIDREDCSRHIPSDNS
jgi:hypothetical protein